MKKSPLLAACLAALIIATIAIAGFANRDATANSAQAAAQPAHVQAGLSTPF